MAVRFSVAIFVATAAAVVLRATPGTAERTNEKMDRVLEIINTELCFGNPPMKCKCYTDNEVFGAFESLKEYGKCLPETCTCEEYGLVNVMSFRSMNEFLCGFDVPESFVCLDGRTTREGPYKTMDDFKQCTPIAFKCKEGRVHIGLDDPFKGFYTANECA